MTKEEEEVLYQRWADRAVAVFKKARRHHPETEDIVVVLLDGNVKPLPLAAFEEELGPYSPDLVEVFSRGRVEPGAFWFVMIAEQEFVLRVVHPAQRAAEKARG